MSAAREPGRVVPAPLLVLGGIGSVQVGAAVAKRLFAAVGPAGAVLLRLAIAAAILLAVLGLGGCDGMPAWHGERASVSSCCSASCSRP